MIIPKENIYIWYPSFVNDKLPNYNISHIFDKWKEIHLDGNEKYSVYTLSDTNSNKTIFYDIERVSSRNARKSKLGPYKNSFLREIILSYNMGKTSGVKQDLVSTILSFHESKSK